MTETIQRDGLKDVSRNADIQKYATQSVEYDGNGQQQS